MRNFPYRVYRLVYNGKEWILKRFTSAGMFMLAVLVVSALGGMGVALSMIYQVFTLTAAILLIAFLPTVRFRSKIQIESDPPRLASVGRRLDYTIVVTNDGEKIQTDLNVAEQFEDPRPTEAEFNQPAADGGARRKKTFKNIPGFGHWSRLTRIKQGAGPVAAPLPPLPPGAPQRIPLALTPRRRGRIQLTGVRVARPDPLGLCRGSFFVSLPRSITVLPKRYALPVIHLPGLRRHQSGGVSLTASVGDSEEFISLRDYRPGDPLRRIHWKSLAKTGKPIVKEHQEEYFVRHALVLDTFTNEGEAFEEAVSLAASFACTVQTRESLLDLIFVGTEAFRFTAGRSLGHTDRILEVLAGVRPCLDKSFESIFSAILPEAAAWSGCICIFLAWDEQRQTLVRRLRRIHMPVLVLVASDADGPETLEPGPMSDMPNRLIALRAGEIEKGLAGIQTS